MRTLIRGIAARVFRAAGARNRERIYELALQTMGEAEHDRFVERNNLLAETTTYRRLRRLGFRPGHIIDVGAYRGEWTREIAGIFPEAHILMVEGQRSKETALRAVAATLPRVSYHIGIVGAAESDAPFYEMESGSSLRAEASCVTRVVTQQHLTTLDAIAREADFLKLDVQGAELDVLAGAQHLLRYAQAVQLETQLIPINQGAPRFHEVIAYMADRDFIAYDLFSPWRRPKDGAMWTVDVLFLRDGSPLIGEARYDAAQMSGLTEPI